LKTSPAIFLAHCRAQGLPEPTPEHRFHPERRWRFDYAWLDAKIALEVEGGIWTGGRHTSPKGFEADIEKYNAAACLGWRVLRTTPKNLLTLRTAQAVKAARCA
jgi:very-short-patch-repair endonuclease